MSREKRERCSHGEQEGRPIWGFQINSFFNKLLGHLAQSYPFILNKGSRLKELLTLD